LALGEVERMGEGGTMIRFAASQKIHPAEETTLVKDTELGRTIPELSH